MDGANRVGNAPLEVSREFVGSRLETQLLIRAYELVAPVIRRSADSARMSSTQEAREQDCPQQQRMAQGA